MSTAPECDQTAGQLISLMEFGFLKVQQRLLRQELLLSELQANANIDAELTSDRHNNILNILKVIYNNTYNNSSNAGAKGIHESDFHKHVQPHLLKWTFHYSPLCFEIREILKSFKGSDEAKLKTEQESRRLKNYLAQLKADHTAGATTGRSGYFRFLRQVIKSMPSFAPLPDKRAVHFVSAELCDYWNCGLPYVKSHDNKLIELISFEDVYEDLWRIMREKKNKTTYRARKAASLVTPSVSRLRKLNKSGKNHSPSSKVQGGSKLSSNASVLSESGSELESGSEAEESCIEGEGDGSGSDNDNYDDDGDSGSESMNRSADGSIASSRASRASKASKAMSTSASVRSHASVKTPPEVVAPPPVESALFTPERRYTYNGGNSVREVIWPDQSSPSYSQSYSQSQSQGQRGATSNSGSCSGDEHGGQSFSQDSQDSGRLTRSSAAKLSASASVTGSSSKTRGAQRSAIEHTGRTGSARSEISPELWRKVFASTSCSVRVGSFRTLTTHTAGSAGPQQVTDLSAEPGLSQTSQINRASSSSQAGAVLQPAKSHYVAAATAQLAAVSKQYEHACAQERLILLGSDAALFAKLSFLGDAVQPPTSYPTTELFVEQNHHAADAVVGARTASATSPNKPNTMPIPVAVAARLTAGAAASTSSSALLVRSSSAITATATTAGIGSGTHTYFSSAEEEEGSGGGKSDTEKEKQGQEEGAGRTAKKQRVAGASTAQSRLNQADDAVNDGGNQVTLPEGAAIATAPVTSAVAAMAVPASVKSLAKDGFEEQAFLSAAGATPTSSSSRSVCSSGDSVGSNRTGHSFASSSSSSSSSSSVCSASSSGSSRHSPSDSSVSSGAITPFRPAGARERGLGLTPGSAIRTFPYQDLLSDHKEHKEHKHSKHRKHKRHRTEDPDVDNNDNSSVVEGAGEGAGEEGRRKHRRKRKHRDRVGTSEEIIAVSLTQCSE